MPAIEASESVFERRIILLFFSLLCLINTITSAICCRLADKVVCICYFITCYWWKGQSPVMNLSSLQKLLSVLNILMYNNNGVRLGAGTIALLALRLHKFLVEHIVLREWRKKQSIMPNSGNIMSLIWSILHLMLFLLLSFDYYLLALST